MALGNSGCRRVREAAAIAVAALALAFTVVTTASPAAGSIFDNSTRWPSAVRPGGSLKGKAVINVCMVDGSTAEQKVDSTTIHDPNPSLDSVIAKVRDALDRTWVSHGGVRFTGFRWCRDLPGSEQQESIGFWISPDAPNKAVYYPGAKGLVDRSAQGISAVNIKPWGNGADEDQCINFEGGRYRYRYDCAVENALHEFGHTLGFVHEWRHPSRPSSCTKNDAGETALPMAVVESTYSGTADRYFIPNLSNYDWDSLMVYDDICADVTGTRYGSPSPSEIDYQGLRTVYPQTYDVGVVEGADGCVGAETVTVRMDADDGHASTVTGFTGSAHILDNDLVMEFCRADGDRFGRLPGTGRTGDYAVLKLDTQCPVGAVEIIRYFDNEDKAFQATNGNSLAATEVGDGWYPNEQPVAAKVQSGYVATTTDTRLSFCMFLPEEASRSIDQLPVLGYEYGVFAPDDFAFGGSTGIIYSDDEDSFNNNSRAFVPSCLAQPAVCSKLPTWAGAADRIVYDVFDGNTVMKVAQVAVGVGLDAIADITVDEDAGAQSVPVKVIHPSADSVTVTATSSNTNLVPAANLSVRGSGSDRTLILQSAPDESGDAVITVTATHGSTTATEAFTVSVRPVNDPPVLAGIPDLTVDEEQTLTFTASATDVDSSSVTYSLSGAPDGATLDPATGAFAWTPTEAQDGSHVFDIVASDGTATATRPVRVTVREVNRQPELAELQDVSGPWGAPITFTATATDPDRPSNTLTFRLAGAVPDGANISPDGVFSWTPTAAQIGTSSMTVEVVDSASPPATASDVVTVTVTKRLTEVRYIGAGTGQFSDPVTLAATVLDASPGAPNGRGLIGHLLSFSLGSQTASAPSGPDGNGTAELIIDQPASSTPVVSAFAGDDAYEASSVSTPFQIRPELLTIASTGPTLLSTDRPGGTRAVPVSAAISEEADGFPIPASLNDLGVTTSFGAGEAMCTSPPLAVSAGESVAGCAMQAGAGQFTLRVEVAGGGFVAAAPTEAPLTVTSPHAGSVQGRGEVAGTGAGGDASRLEGGGAFGSGSSRVGAPRGAFVHQYTQSIDLSTLIPGAPAGTRTYEVVATARTLDGLSLCRSPGCRVRGAGTAEVTYVDRPGRTVYRLPADVLGRQPWLEVVIVDGRSSGPDSVGVRISNSARSLYEVGVPNPIPLRSGDFVVR